MQTTQHDYWIGYLAADSRRCGLSMHTSFYSGSLGMFAEPQRCNEHFEFNATVNNTATSRTCTKRRRMAAAPPTAAVDVAYVRRVLRKHRDADRRAAAATVIVGCPPKSCVEKKSSKLNQEISATSECTDSFSTALCSSYGAVHNHSTDSESHSDSNSSCYESDGCSSSECSSGCWDETTWPIESPAPETATCDDALLDELLAVGSSCSDPWVADSM
jgi:hypothetical protein